MRLAEPLGFSVVEIILLVALVVASLGMFAYRLWPIARNVFHAKKDVGFKLTPLGRRVWVFVWEVLCQAKVIRQRPLPGVAHAFVFWGFLAFALVSLNHMATGVRLGFLQHVGYVGDFYFWWSVSAFQTFATGAAISTCFSTLFSISIPLPIRNSIVAYYT